MKWLILVLVLAGCRAPLGVFEPGWETDPIQNVEYQQTYVGACAEAYVLPHRLEQMHGNKPFTYIENSGHEIEDILTGALDTCWRTILSQVPEGEIVAPIAEANGDWVSYHGTPEQVAQAYARLRTLDPGTHRWCGSFTIMGNTQQYMDAVLPYVDLWCPSAYDWNGEIDVPNKIRSVETRGLPVLLAQTGTVREDKAGWLDQLRLDLYGEVEAVIYFNKDQYAFDWKETE